jgi:hypothetical protein
MSDSFTQLVTPEREHNGAWKERVFLPTQLENVLLLMHESRATGTLMLDISQGSLNSIRFREEHKITPSSNKA